MTLPTAGDAGHHESAETHDLRQVLPENVLRTIGQRYDRQRFAAFAAPGPELAGQIGAFANSTGGHILLGAAIDPETGAVGAAEGIDAATARAGLDEALSHVDPPVEHLVTMQAVSSPDGVPLAFISVGQSSAPPHLIVPEGHVLISLASGIRNVHSRAELDALYSRGRTERERADRQIDAMIEKLVQAHYAVYGIGFVACTQSPNAEPYLWARDNVAQLLSESEPFSSGWSLTEEIAKVRPGEVELRGEKEAHGYLRITRSGCAAAGEVRRRPPGNTIGTVDDVARRVGQLIELTCRYLSRPPNETIVPRLFFEGLRGQKVIVGEQPYAESSGMEIDTLQFLGNVGNPSDPAYVHRITQDLLTRFFAGFKVDYEGDTVLADER